MRPAPIAFRFLRLFLPLAALLALAAAWYRHDDLTRAEATLAGNDAARLTVGAATVARDLTGIATDLAFLAGNDVFTHMGPHLSEEDRTRLSREFLRLAAAKTRYDQIRYLDEAGMEVVRVNFNGGRPSVVPESQLQNKAGRYYFMDVFERGQGEVYVSPFDLNIEGDAIERPLKPMIRIGTPVLDQQGRKRGIVLLNYLGTTLIDHFRASVGELADRAMLLNRDGYWLSAPWPEREWGFMFGNDETLAKYSPDAWRRIQQDGSGQFRTDDGLYSFASVRPLTSGQSSSSGSAEALAPSLGAVAATAYAWTAVIHAPPALLAGLAAESNRRTLWIFLPALVAVTAGSAWFTLAAEHQRTAELARRLSDQRKAQVVEHAFDGIITVDSDGRILEFNPSAERIFGHSAAAATGRPLVELLAPVAHPSIPKPNRGHDERIAVHADGHRFPIEISVTASPLAGQPPLTAIMVRDISERKAAETAQRASDAALRAANARLNMVLETVDEGVFGIDDEGRIIFVNRTAARLLDRDFPQDMIGRLSSEVIGHFLADGRPCHQGPCQIQATLTDGQTRRVADESFAGQRDRAIPVEYVVSPLVVADVVVGAVVAFHDISDRRAMEEELRRSNRDLEQFAYAASHDLRQPLRMVTSYLELIKKRLGPELDDDLGGYLGYAVAGARKLDHLVLDLLAYSRIGRGGDSPVPVSLADIATDIRHDLGLAFLESGAEFTVQDGLPTVLGYPTELMRLFQNLVGNSIKYRSADRAARISVSWARDGESWRIAVCDNGIGIAPEHRDEAFQVFRRLVHSDQYEGSGIGLAMCRKIVEIHGGRIGIEDGDQGGTKVVFTLPVMAEDGSVADPQLGQLGGDGAE